MIRKKIGMFLAGLGSVSVAFAGTMGEAGCTSVLCAMNGPGGFYAAGTAFYMQPAETGLGFVTDSWVYNSPNGPVARSKPFNVPYKWAGAVKLGYDFPLSANNIEANYLFLSNKNHAINDFSDGAFGFGSILFPNASFPVLPGFVSDAFLKYEVNQVDLKAGRKYTDMSTDFNIRGSLGVRYVGLEHKLTFAAPGHMISRFWGVGPLFSVDTHYNLGSSIGFAGLGLVGYFDYAMLAGQSNAHSQVFNFYFVWPKRQRVVNNVTAKLGLDYSFAWNTASITIEGGYQLNQYFGSLDTIRGNTGLDSQNVPDGIQRIAGYETNNFAIQGPYVTLTVHA